MRRWLWAGLFLLLLSGSANATGAADGPGCIGVTLADCVGWLRTSMRLNETSLARATAERQRTDVNGRRLGGLVTVRAQIPGRMEIFVILLHLMPDERIQWVEGSLLHNPVEARTEQEYDRTGLYEIAWRLLGHRCAGLDKLELYRFFENVVKPRAQQERRDLANGLFGLHRIVTRAVGIPFCSSTFGYTNEVEWHGSAEPEAGRSPTSFSQIDLR